MGEYARSGLRAAAEIYPATGDRNWEVTSFLEGAVVQQPAVFLYGSDDPSLMPNYGIDRQGPLLAALPEIYLKLEVVELPGVGHTPPEEAAQAVNELLLKFLARIKPMTEG